VQNVHLEHPMAKVPAGRFQKNFRHFRTLAQREAITVTSHGRDDVVLLSAREYHRLRNLERRSMPVSELNDDELRAIERVETPTEASRYDRELT
jgi:PHD/YefM family antitoxin component YafN of YafNO toxin-antitoxin module